MKTKAEKTSTQQPLEFLTDQALRDAITAQAESRGVTVATLLTEVIAAHVNHEQPTASVREIPGIRVQVRRPADLMVKQRREGWYTGLEDRLIRVSCEATLSRLLLTDLYQRLLPDSDLDAVLERMLPEVQRLLDDPLLELEDYRAIKDDRVLVADLESLTV